MPDRRDPRTKTTLEDVARLYGLTPEQADRALKGCRRALYRDDVDEVRLFPISGDVKVKDVLFLPDEEET